MKLTQKLNNTSLDKEYIKRITKATEELHAMFQQNLNMTDSNPNLRAKNIAVYVINEMDTILDFINHCDESIKRTILDCLDKKSVADKALFLTSRQEEDSTEFTYIILLNINNKEWDDSNLMLIHSKNVEAVAMFMEEFSDLSSEEVIKQFIK